MERLSKWIVVKQNFSTPGFAARTAVAAVVSYIVAGLFRLPEAYWATIATLIVMQPSLGASLPISVQRFAGTALGASVGGVAATYFPGNAWVFAVAALLIGLLCAVSRVERGTYRYACITLAIVMLVPRSNVAWLIALHRFFEVSVGIAVGLVLSALWPEQQSDSPDPAK